MKTLISILVLLFSNIVWAKPGDTYLCFSKYGEVISMHSGSIDWGGEFFHFKWSLENVITFEEKVFQKFKIKDYDSNLGEFFNEYLLDGYISVNYMDGVFTYTQTSSGMIWYVLANCKILDL